MARASPAMTTLGRADLLIEYHIQCARCFAIERPGAPLVGLASSADFSELRFSP